MTVRAPYNFVPLSGKVHSTADADRISHDVPYSDGVSGHLTVELHVHTPLCVGGPRAKGDPIEPLRDVDDRIVLPGTAVKGMLRNVVEIASFAKFQFVDRSRRYAVRDLTPAGRFYRDQLTQTVRGAGGDVYVPKTRTGWLRAEGDRWMIQRCDVFRVEQDELLKFLGDAKETLRRSFIGSQIPMTSKYAAWQEADQSLEIRFQAGPVTDVRMSRGRGSLRLRRATDLGKGEASGTLVFTGQASPNENLKSGRSGGKHREFVFGEGQGDAVEVAADVQQDFRLNHGESLGEKHGGQDRGNREWEYWQERLDRGEPVPVFFLAAGDRVTSLGLAQMYRLAYKHRVGDLIDRASIDHHPDPGAVEDNEVLRPVPDLADALFGYVTSHKSGSDALRGRADVGPLRLRGAERLTPVLRAVLGQPKPTFYPAYVTQSTGPDGTRLRDGDYKTYMDDDAELRGWKRYPARSQAARLDPVREDQKKVASTWRAIESGGVLEGRIHLHNLRPHELGALLWAIDFGGRPTHRHQLGYARPFGFGSVALKVTESDLQPNRGTEPVDLDTARAAYIDAMQEALGEHDWEASPQVAALLAMADPALGDEHDLTYPRLDHKNRVNEFSQMKKDRAVLPPPGPFDGPSDAQRYPRSAPASAWRQRREQEEKTRGKALAELEFRRRLELTPLERVLEDYRERVEATEPDILAQWMRDEMPRDVPETDEKDPAAWADAIREIFAPALEVVRNRAAGEGAADVARVRAEMQEHGAKKPKDRRSGAFRRWKKQGKKFENRLTELQRHASRVQAEAEHWITFLAWLDAIGTETTQRDTSTDDGA